MISAIKVLAVVVVAFSAFTLHSTQRVDAAAVIKPIKCPKWANSGYWCPPKPKVP